MDKAEERINEKSSSLKSNTISGSNQGPVSDIDIEINDNSEDIQEVKTIKNTSVHSLDIETIDDESDDVNCTPVKKRKFQDESVSKVNKSLQQNSIASCESQGNGPAKQGEGGRKRFVFVGNIPLNMDKCEIVDLFKKYGEVMKVKFAKFISSASSKKKRVVPEHRASLRAYITFKTVDEAENSLKLNGYAVSGRHLRVEKAFPDPFKGDKIEKTVTIYGFSFDIDEDDVQSAFSSCGDIEFVRFKHDHGNFFDMGSGYVCFKNKNSAQSALNLDNTEIKGCKIGVKLFADAKKKEKGGKGDVKSFSDQKVQNKWKGLKDRGIELNKARTEKSGMEESSSCVSSSRYFNMVKQVSVGSRKFSSKILPDQKDNSEDIVAVDINCPVVSDLSNNRDLKNLCLDVNSPDPNTSVSEEPSAKKMCCTDITKTIIEIEQRKISLLEQRCDEDNDDNLLFLKSLLPYMKKIPVKKKLLFRKNIEELLIAESEVCNDV